jgi:hypothetical protein
MVVMVIVMAVTAAVGRLVRISVGQSVGRLWWWWWWW